MTNIEQERALPALPEPAERFVFGGLDWHRATHEYFEQATSAKFCLFTADQMREYGRQSAEIERLRQEFERGKADGWEACETCHGIVDGVHQRAKKLEQERDRLREALKPFADIDLTNVNITASFGMRVLRARAAIAATTKAEPKGEVIRCPDRLKNNGVCPHHNLQCGWPQCNEEPK